MTVVVRRTLATLNSDALSELLTQDNTEGDLIAARDEAAASADVARLAAAEAGATIFFTFAAALAGAVSIPDGDLVKVLVDETRNGQQTIYQVDQPDTPSLVLNFEANTFQSGTPVLELDFVRLVGANFVPVPPTSTSSGFAGDIAVNATHVYFAVGPNSWKRITLESF